MWKNADVPRADVTPLIKPSGTDTHTHCTGIWSPRQYIDMSHIAIGNLTYLLLPTKHIYYARPREQTIPMKHISWFNNRQVTQITYAALYKHLALLFSDSSQLCIYMTSPHILPPNVWKCHQHYFQSTSIHSYPSMSSTVYYYTKVLPSRNYFHWSFIKKEQNYIRSP